MPRVHQFIIALLLTMSAVALAWGIYSTSQPPEEPLTSVPAASELTIETDDPDQPPAMEIPPPLTDFSQMVERPLFAQSRSPEDPAAETAASPLPQPTGKSQLIVMGIIITEGEKVALLKQNNAKGGDTLKVKEGQEVSGWKVASITPESVTVSQRETTDVIKLSDNVLSDAEKRRLESLAKASKASLRKQRANKNAPKTPPAARLPAGVRRQAAESAAKRRQNTTR